MTDLAPSEMTNEPAVQSVSMDVVAENGQADTEISHPKEPTNIADKLDEDPPTGHEPVKTSGVGDLLQTTMPFPELLEVTKEGEPHAQDAVGLKESEIAGEPAKDAEMVKDAPPPVLEEVPSIVEEPATVVLSDHLSFSEQERVTIIPSQTPVHGSELAVGDLETDAKANDVVDPAGGLHTDQDGAAQLHDEPVTTVLSNEPRTIEQEPPTTLASQEIAQHPEPEPTAEALAVEHPQETVIDHTGEGNGDSLSAEAESEEHVQSSKTPEEPIRDGAAEAGPDLVHPTFPSEEAIREPQTASIHTPSAPSHAEEQITGGIEPPEAGAVHSDEKAFVPAEEQASPESDPLVSTQTPHASTEGVQTMLAEPVIADGAQGSMDDVDPAPDSWEYVETDPPKEAEEAAAPEVAEETGGEAADKVDSPEKEGEELAEEAKEEEGAKNTTVQEDSAIQPAEVTVAKPRAEPPANDYRESDHARVDSTPEPASEELHQEDSKPAHAEEQMNLTHARDLVQTIAVPVKAAPETAGDLLPEGDSLAEAGESKGEVIPKVGEPANPPDLEKQAVLSMQSLIDIPSTERTAVIVGSEDGGVEDVLAALPLYAAKDEGGLQPSLDLPVIASTPGMEQDTMEDETETVQAPEAGMNAPALQHDQNDHESVSLNQQGSALVAQDDVASSFESDAVEEPLTSTYLGHAGSGHSDGSTVESNSPPGAVAEVPNADEGFRRRQSMNSEFVEAAAVEPSRHDSFVRPASENQGEESCDDIGGKEAESADIERGMDQISEFATSAESESTRHDSAATTAKVPHASHKSSFGLDDTVAERQFEFGAIVDHVAVGAQDVIAVTPMHETDMGGTPPEGDTVGSEPSPQTDAKPEQLSAPVPTSLSTSLDNAATMGGPQSDDSRGSKQDGEFPSGGVVTELPAFGEGPALAETSSFSSHIFSEDEAKETQAGMIKSTTEEPILDPVKEEFHAIPDPAGPAANVSPRDITVGQSDMLDSLLDSFVAIPSMAPAEEPATESITARSNEPVKGEATKPAAILTEPTTNVEEHPTLDLPNEKAMREEAVAGVLVPATPVELTEPVTSAEENAVVEGAGIGTADLPALEKPIEIEDPTLAPTHVDADLSLHLSEGTSPAPGEAMFASEPLDESFILTEPITAADEHGPLGLSDYSILTSSGLSFPPIEEPLLSQAALTEPVTAAETYMTQPGSIVDERSFAGHKENSRAVNANDEPPLVMVDTGVPHAGKDGETVAEVEEIAEEQSATSAPQIGGSVATEAVEPTERYASKENEEPVAGPTEPIEGVMEHAVLDAPVAMATARTGDDVPVPSGPQFPVQLTEPITTAEESTFSEASTIGNNDLAALETSLVLQEPTVAVMHGGLDGAQEISDSAAMLSGGEAGSQPVDEPFVLTEPSASADEHASLGLSDCSVLTSPDVSFPPPEEDLLSQAALTEPVVLAEEHAIGENSLPDEALPVIETRESEASKQPFVSPAQLAPVEDLGTVHTQDNDDVLAEPIRGVKGQSSELGTEGAVTIDTMEPSDRDIEQAVVPPASITEPVTTVEETMPSDVSIEQVGKEDISLDAEPSEPPAELTEPITIAEVKAGLETAKAASEDLAVLETPLDLGDPLVGVMYSDLDEGPQISHERALTESSGPIDTSNAFADSLGFTEPISVSDEQAPVRLSDHPVAEAPTVAHPEQAIVVQTVVTEPIDAAEEHAGDPMGAIDETGAAETVSSLYGPGIAEATLGMAGGSDLAIAGNHDLDQTAQAEMGLLETFPYEMVDDSLLIEYAVLPERLTDPASDAPSSAGGSDIAREVIASDGMTQPLDDPEPEGHDTSADTPSDVTNEVVHHAAVPLDTPRSPVLEEEQVLDDAAQNSADRTAEWIDAGSAGSAEHMNDLEDPGSLTANLAKDLDKQSVFSEDSVVSLAPSSPRSDLAASAQFDFPVHLNSADLAKLEQEIRPSHHLLSRRLGTSTMSEASMQPEPPSSPSRLSDLSLPLEESERRDSIATVVPVKRMLPQIIATTPTPTRETTGPISGYPDPPSDARQQDDGSLDDLTYGERYAEPSSFAGGSLGLTLTMPMYRTNKTREDDEMSESAETSVSDASHVPAASTTPIQAISPVATPSLERSSAMFTGSLSPLSSEILPEMSVATPSSEGIIPSNLVDSSDPDDTIMRVQGTLPDAVGSLTDASYEEEMAPEVPAAPELQDRSNSVPLDDATVPPEQASAEAGYPEGTISPPSITDLANLGIEAEVSEWETKEILWSNTDDRNTSTPIRIITQARNGSCSLIALCNVLILRGDIEILPPGRTTVSYDYLSSLVASFLLNTREPKLLASALSALPRTRYGLDINPIFTRISGFKPRDRSADDQGGELALFHLSRVPLLHGWLVDPSASGADVIARTGDYETTQELVFVGDQLTDGQLLSLDQNDINIEVLDNPKWTVAERQKVQDAFSLHQFLDSTRTQLTYYGLFSISEALRAGELAVLFRNSHLSVIYKRAVADSGNGNTAPALYTLVTDSAFVSEPEVVWETLGDTEGASTFVNSAFHPASALGGDWAGQSEHVFQDIDRGEHVDGFYDNDLALAQQLQAEEDEEASSTVRAASRSPADLPAMLAPEVPKRTRQISTTSNITVHPPGAWLTQVPPKPQHYESHDSADGEFSPITGTSREGLRKHGHDSQGDKQEEKKSRCVIM